MSQTGAQLSSVNTLKHNLPSIFEVLAQESLISTLRPALKHVFKVMAQNNPERFGFLFQYSDEIYTGLQLTIDNYYLKHYYASFSENFYGLKRVSMNSEKTNQLSTSQHLKSLFFLVVVPYLKNKCDQLFERLSTDDSNHQNQRRQMTMKKKFCRVFLAFYPIFHAVSEFILLSYRLAYVFRKSLHHSPLIRLSGVLLQNLTENDIEDFSKWSDSNQTLKEFLQTNSWWKLILLLIKRGFVLLSVILSSGLSLGIFFLQFLDWWFARDQHATSLMALPIPDCPKQHSLRGLSKVVTICPLCNRIRTNDTALSVTGYVFCYRCIYRFIEEKRCCPITGFPASHQHLVKLFLSDG